MSASCDFSLTFSQLPATDPVGQWGYPGRFNGPWEETVYVLGDDGEFAIRN